MRTLDRLLLATLVAVLSFIAYDLHRVAVAVAPAPAAQAQAGTTVTATTETHEQRVERVRREYGEIRADAEALVELRDREARSRK